MATKKISQLETISDSNLSGEAILPVVVSDPLIPNRKAKVNQLMKGVSQGTKNEPGLCFDLDRDTGLYQDAYNQIGVAFGDGGLYATRLDNGNDSTSLYVTAVDDVAQNTDIVFAPKGTGSVKITGQFLIEDSSFVLEDSQGPKVRFEVGNVGTGTNTRIMTLPQITQGNGTTIVGDNTTQTLTNKTLLIDEDNFVIVDGTEEAIFQINWPTTSGTRRSYFLPDAGAVTTSGEPTATSSTLLDTKTEQTTLNKTLVTPKMAANADDGTNWVQWNTSALSANRTISCPDQSLILVGTESTQTLTNKTVSGLIVSDTVDPTTGKPEYFYRIIDSEGTNASDKFRGLQLVDPSLSLANGWTKKSDALNVMKNLLLSIPETKTYKFFLSKLIFLYLNSEAISISIEMVVSSSSQYFAMKQE